MSTNPNSRHICERQQIQLHEPFCKYSQTKIWGTFVTGQSSKFQIIFECPQIHIFAHRPNFTDTVETFVKVCISSLTLYPVSAYKSKIKRLFECPLIQIHGTLCEYLQIRTKKTFVKVTDQMYRTFWKAHTVNFTGLSASSRSKVKRLLWMCTVTNILHFSKFPHAQLYFPFVSGQRSKFKLHFVKAQRSKFIRDFFLHILKWNSLHV